MRTATALSFFLLVRVTTAAALLALATAPPAPGAPAPARPPARVASPATPAPTPTPAPAPLGDAEVTEFVREWPAFDRALSSLGEAPDPGDREPLTAASLAVLESEALRGALARDGIDGSRFLDLYRRVAQAWAALREQDEREATEAALGERITSLEAIARRDDARGARETLERLKASRAAQERQEATLRVPDAALAAVRAHRDDLERILGAGG